MESANSHHQLQDQLVGSSASSLATPNSCYELGNITAHPSWTPTNSFLNTNGFSSYPCSETILSSSRETRQHENTLVSSHYTTSMAPDVSFSWANGATTPNLIATNHQSEQDIQHSRIKEELANHYYRKYTEMLSGSTSPPPCSTNEQGNLQPNEFGTKLLLKSFSSGNLMNKIQLSPGDLYSNNDAQNNGIRGFSQIFPSINVSNLNQAGLASGGGSLDMNLEALDLLASSRFTAGGNFVASSQNQIGMLRDGFSYGFDHMQQSHQIPFYGSNKVSTSSNAVVEAKRNSNKMEPKTQIQNAPKKSRLEARSSCPPFKVRKEKLGDRIAALQQLVAPFGKTDTASVLMEAIGYIKFLQNQVETLSVPYMKASRSKANRVIKGVQGSAENEINEESKRDLKSRGLCLVPLSCLSYITDGGGAAVWPPPHFGGAT